jgi:hypothetical protein
MEKAPSEATGFIEKFIFSGSKPIKSRQKKNYKSSVSHFRG